MPTKFNSEDIGFYRDDGLALLADKARKELHEILHQLGLKITAKVENQSVSFLHKTVNLKDQNIPLTENTTTNHYMLTADQTTLHPP